MYIPILRAKEGELVALKELEMEVKNQIAPLIQIVPIKETIPAKLATEKTKAKPERVYTAEESAESVSTKIIQAWGTANTPVYLDFSFVERYHYGDFEAYIMYILEILESGGITIIPVVHPDSSQFLIDAVNDLAQDNGACLRIQDNYNSRVVLDAIDRVKDQLGLNDAENVHLLLDFRYIINDESPWVITANDIFNNLPDPGEFEKIIIGGGSFPSDVSGVLVDTIGTFRRLEKGLFDQLVAGDGIEEELTYADYVNVHPLFDPTAPPFQGSSSIKYTTEEEFKVFRGVRAQDHRHGNGQYILKSRLLIAERFYDGEEFSWGDAVIMEKARRRTLSDRPGHPPQWVKITVNHHLTKIVDIL